jgi:hypothetical protein
MPKASRRRASVEREGAAIREAVTSAPLVLEAVTVPYVAAGTEMVAGDATTGRRAAVQKGAIVAAETGAARRMDSAGSTASS